MALCYFNPEPIRKITITGQAPDSGYPNSTLVEFLGEGQQLACYGIHPDNRGRPYRWEDATLFDFPLEGLPQIDPALIREAAHAVMKTLETLGYSNLKVTGGGSSEPRDRGRSHGEPVTADMLEAMLAKIDPACDRLTWIKVAGAIKSARVIDLAAGDDDQDFDDADLFDRWSAGELNPDHAPGNYEGRPDCDNAYESVTAGRPGGSGVGSIVELAREGDYNGPIRIPAIERLRGVAKTQAEAGLDVADVSPDEIPTEDEGEDLDAQLPGREFRRYSRRPLPS